jgi:hypothetical protein
MWLETGLPEPAKSLCGRFGGVGLMLALLLPKHTLSLKSE